MPRPLAHDLMRSLLESVDASVTGVAVTRIEEGTFYAEITLSTTLGERIVDARPSDAVALASRVERPDLGGGSSDGRRRRARQCHRGDETRSKPPRVGAEAEERLDEFKRFLEDVDPEDFRG